MTAKVQTTTETDIFGIGPAETYYKGTPLGATQGGTTVKISMDIYEQVIDKYGSTPIDSYELATNIEATLLLKEETIAKIGVVTPASTVDSTKLTFGHAVGSKITGGRLIVSPYDGDFHDLIIYKAVPKPEITLAYSNDGERIYEVTFKGNIDGTRAENDKLFRLDESYSI